MISDMLKIYHIFFSSQALMSGHLSKPGDRRFDDWEKGRGGIDLLAERGAEVVKMEVLRFFQRGEG